jgi:hypothetical protein
VRTRAVEAISLDEETPGDAMTKELWALGALDLAERIAAKKISAREVIGAHLARIEAGGLPGG